MEREAAAAATIGLTAEELQQTAANPYAALYWALGLIVLFAIMRGLFAFAQSYMSEMAGQSVAFDVQGRVIIPPRLRDSASMTGDVDVLGQVNYLEVWNHERFLAKLQREPFTDDDARALAEFGI